jgi:hypothetical protein
VRGADGNVEFLAHLVARPAPPIPVLAERIDAPTLAASAVPAEVADPAHPADPGRA